MSATTPASSYAGDREVWPTKCLESERRFGHEAARLYPLIDKRVSTTRGDGTLFNVRSDACLVALDSSPKKKFEGVREPLRPTSEIAPEDVFPEGVAK